MSIGLRVLAIVVSTSFAAPADPASAASIATLDANAVATFVAGAQGPAGFDDVPGNAVSPGSAVNPANAISDRYAPIGLLFSSTGGPAVAIDFPSDARSDPNLLAGTSLSGSTVVVDYLQPLTVRFIVPGTNVPATTGLVGAWLDPTGSKVKLDVFDQLDSLIESTQADQGEFIGIRAPGIARATFSYAQTETIPGFSLDDLFFGSLPTVTTTTSSSTTSSSTSSTTSSTSTTRPPQEICGDCVDNDDNGLTDFEDPACCSGANVLAVTLKRGRIVPLGAASKLKLKTLLASAAGLDPAKKDIYVQLRQDGGPELLCAKLPAASVVKKGKRYRFVDPTHQIASADGIDVFRLQVTKKGVGKLTASGKQAQFRSPGAARLRLTFGFKDATDAAANRCASSTQPFKATKKGALHFP